MKQHYCGDKDTLYIVLNSHTRDSGSEGDAFYNIKLPVKRNNYFKYVLYVDNYVLDTAGLEKDHILVHMMGASQSNSYNSTSKGTNDVIAVVCQNGSGANRTTDLQSQYQAPLAPIELDNLPSFINIYHTDNLNLPIGLSSNNNDYVIALRIECYYMESGDTALNLK